MRRRVIQHWGDGAKWVLKLDGLVELREIFAVWGVQRSFLESETLIPSSESASVNSWNVPLLFGIDVLKQHIEEVRL